jgi:hypothetical protein
LVSKKILFLSFYVIVDMDVEAYVGVELANEAGEVVVLEVFWEQIASELSGTPNYEGRSVVVPGNEFVNARVLHQLVCLGEEWSGYRSLRVSGSWSGSRSCSGISCLFDW